jgi:hypothetical protein
MGMRNVRPQALHHATRLPCTQQIPHPNNLYLRVNPLCNCICTWLSSRTAQDKTHVVAGSRLCRRQLQNVALGTGKATGQQEMDDAHAASNGVNGSIPAWNSVRQ